MTQLNNTFPQIESLLEDGVMVSWADLSQVCKSDSVHVEYECAPDGDMNYLAIWLCVRKGTQLLACTYSMAGSRSQKIGLRFENGCKSDALRTILPRLMHNQRLFGVSRPFGGRGLLQIGQPTVEQVEAAASSIRNALRGLPSEGDLAA